MDINDQCNVHKCKSCSYITRSLGVFLSHLLQHKRRSKDDRFICFLRSLEDYLCEKCRLPFQEKVLLTRHFNTFHKSEETEHYLNPILRNCENCDFQTYSSLVFLNHHNRCDGPEYHVFQISQTENNNCQREKEKKQSDLKKRQHTKLEGISFQCDHCSFKTAHKGYLKKHVLAKHTPSEEINWLKCKHCSYRAKRIADLKKHMISMHTLLEEIIWFQCAHCSHKTAFKENLKKHVLNRHTPSEEINWYRCEHCSYKGKRKCALSKHIRTQHPQVSQVEDVKCPK